ncbi:hypothetical protein [Rhodopila sp.]|uniref:hypothetical protein n=1 Tax=Rhodopila sp. TaxID=2480087 RepID=UPI003D0960C2
MLFILWKIPDILQGRLWAEDGLFLLDALHLPWWQALTTPHTGYIDVVASGAMLIATRVTDLDHVALVSVAIALIVQICPVVLLVTTRCEWLRQRRVRLIAVLLVLTPPVAEEIWLSPVTSQYHLMLCAGLILAFEVRRGAIGMLQLLLLGIAGLTGPGPALVAPLFIARACLDRSRRRAIQAAVLSTGALIEITMVCAHPEPGRHLGINPALLLHVIYIKHLVIPFLGPRLAFSVTNRLDRAGLLERYPLIPILVSTMAITGLTLAAATARAREVRWLCAAAFTMMILSYFGALGGQAHLLEIYFGARYYFAPQVLLELTLLSIASTGTGVRRTVTMVLVTWLLIVGIGTYRSINQGMAHGPSWREQVVQWRARNANTVMLWPPTFTIIP